MQKNLEGLMQYQLKKPARAHIQLNWEDRITLLLIIF